MQRYPSQFIVAGCGAMGYPMARRLLQHGFSVKGYDVRPMAEFPGFEQNMLGDLVVSDERTVLIIVVRDVHQIREVCFDRQAVFNQPVYPSTVVVSSTVTPRLLPELRARLPSDVELVDAPMSGAPFSAEDGTLTFMVGGESSTVERLMPAFEAMGDTVHHVGGLGQGMLTKTMNNYVAAATVVAVRRSLRRAEDAGLDTEKLLSVMNTSSGGTWFGTNIEKIDWRAENYAADNTIGILEKDVASSLDVESVDADEFDDALLNALRTLPDYPGVEQ